MSVWTAIKTAFGSEFGKSRPWPWCAVGEHRVPALCFACGYCESCHDICDRCSRCTLACQGHQEAES